MKSLWPLVFVAVVPFLLGVSEPSRVRLPAGAGLLYPKDAAQLKAAVEQYLSAADPVSLPGPVVECIVPHSNMAVCGPIVANAVKPLQRGQYDRVILLSPALVSDFRGCSIPSVQYYQTPLGDIELDGPAIHRVTVSNLIQTRAVVYREDVYTDPQIGRSPIHEREFAGDLVLPFLQVQLGEFKLLPIVVGDMTKNLHIVEANAKPQIDDEGLKTVAGTLRSVMDERTLLVVCSEFTRYGPQYNFTPFQRNIVQGIAELDMKAFNLVQAARYSGFKNYLDETGNPISGKYPILLGLLLLPRTAGGVLMGYSVSAQTTGSRDTSVSYGSLVFFDGSRALTRPAAPAVAQEKQPTAPGDAQEPAAPQAPPEVGAKDAASAGP